MPPPAATAGPASAALRGAMEAVALALTAAAPWAFGAVHPVAVFGLYCGVAVVLVLWAARLLTERRVAGGPCGVLACLAGMVLLGAAQLAPLPADALRAASPATAALRADLVPAEPAALAGEDAVPPPGHTVTLVPGATRKRVAELVALAALFAAVRYAVASPASFRRLAVVCLANAAALAVFALAQRFGGEPGTAYGVFRTRGEPFGPFVCRNHFPFYTNVCVGLGVGLLLAGPPFAGRRGGWADALADLGRRPAALWVLAGLALVVAANALSLSRGGVVALGAAGAGCALLAAGRHGGGVVALVVVAAAAVGLVLWFGPSETAARLATLDDSPLAEGRLQVWERVLPLAADFPLWGTGYGTFEFVEPLTRRPGDDPALLWDHPHNDYLETLVEGGAAQLTIVLVAVGLIARAGVRATGGADAPLALGALLGVGTAVVHAAGDFGMHIPAVVVLVTVVAAQLAAAGARAKGTATTAAGTPLALAAAGACLVAAVVLPLDGWKRERAHRFWLAATRAEARLPAGPRGPAVDYLAAAAAWNPDDTAVAAALADFRYADHQALRAAGRSDTEVSHLLPALRADLRTRAANPLLPRPHLRLAAHADRLAPREPPAAALARACRLAPADPTVWFLAGSQAQADGDRDAACANWRRSLACAPAHLPTIVAAARPLVGPAGLVGRVVPPRAELLAAAAKLLPDADRPAFAAPAAAVAEPRAAAEFHARAWLLREAGDPAAAAAYEDALARAPDRADWRFELAELLAGCDRTADAAAHLGRVLRDRPDHPGARELNAELVRRGAGRIHPPPDSPQ